MKVTQLHDWAVSVTQALEMQLSLVARVSRVSEITVPRLIAGVDISTSKMSEMATGAVVVISYPELKLVAMEVVSEELGFPYIPGLLSFREAPLILAAFEKLTVTPDLVLVDGQGIVHPLRIGLASHLGLFLDKSMIGCAKSCLCGRHQVPGDDPGSYAELVDGSEIIGAALRTRCGVKSVYVSVGHKVDLPMVIHWVLACCRGCRLPESTQLAHPETGGNLRLGKDIVASVAG